MDYGEANDLMRNHIATVSQFSTAPSEREKILWCCCGRTILKGDGFFCSDCGVFVQAINTGSVL